MESPVIKKCLPLAVLALLAAVALHPRAEQKKATPAVPQKPPVLLTKCPDIAVKSVQATLVSTLLGDLQVEVPMDTVRLEATLENVGSDAVPPGAYLFIIVKKNGQVIQSANATDMLGGPGSSWTYSVNDSFPHNRKTTYVFQAATALRECRVSNNQAFLTIDEKKLHPAGNPDLTVSIFAFEKRWKREEDRFLAFFDLAVDVANRGSGHSNSPTRILFVMPDDQVLATLDIAQDELPGPGHKKRFALELAAAQVPEGEFQVSAHVEPARNERVRDNNWSLSSGRIDNTNDPPKRILATLELQPWHLDGRKLSTTVQMTNLQGQYLRKVRLLLLKNNVPVREWKPLQFGPQASSHARYVEELRPPAARSGIDRFRAILTSDLDSASPAATTILDSRTRNLYWLEMSERLLQDHLQDKDHGLAQDVQRQNPDFRVEEARAAIGPGGIRIGVKGKKISGRSPQGEFHAEMVLTPRVVFGQVKLDMTRTSVHLGPGFSDFFSSLLAPVLKQNIRAAIEKFAGRELAANSRAVSSGLRSQYGAPLGIILVDGAMDLYY